MNRTAPPDNPPLAAALRDSADGFYPAEAAAELLIGHASWLRRDYFRDGCVDPRTSVTTKAGDRLASRNSCSLQRRSSLQRREAESTVARGQAGRTAFPLTWATHSTEWTRPMSTGQSMRYCTLRAASGCYTRHLSGAPVASS